jgi:hypothetical protein
MPNTYIGSLFYLKTVTSHFTSSHLSYKNFVVYRTTCLLAVKHDCESEENNSSIFFKNDQ